MRLRLAFFILLSGVGLNGCLHISPPYFPSGEHWSKQGASDREVQEFHWECYAKRREMRDIADLNLIFQLEIEAQNCMLENGFLFKDAPRFEKRMCSREYAQAFNSKGYMIFPACQAKYGK